MMYFWSQELLQKFVGHELQISKETVSEWFQYFREICTSYIEENSQELGGIDENNEPIMVEIDESYFFHRKYHRGAYRKGV